MAISLKNKRNTQLVNDEFESKLIHHGHTTCIVDHSARSVTINLCGHDTLTTRKKINLFIDKVAPRACIMLYRKKGVTMVKHRSYDFELESSRTPIVLAF